MVTLRHAFDANSMKGLVLKILRSTYPEIPSSYSSELKNLISAMLTKDPDERPSINKVLEMDFLQTRITNLLMNSTSAKELGANSLNAKSEKHILKDKSNVLKDAKVKYRPASKIQKRALP